VKSIGDITDLRGTVFARRGHRGLDRDRSTHLDAPGPLNTPVDPYAMRPQELPRRDAPNRVRGCASRAGRRESRALHARVKNADRERSVNPYARLEAVAADPVLYAHASRILHLSRTRVNARGPGAAPRDTDVWLNPPPFAHHAAKWTVYERPTAGAAPAPSFTARRTFPPTR